METITGLLKHIKKIFFALYQITLKRSYLLKAYLTSETIKANSIHQSQYYYSSVKYLDISEDLITKEAIIKKELNYLQSKQVELIKSKADEVKIADVQDELFNKHKSYDSLITHLEQNYPEYYNLKYNFNVLSVEEVQQKLKPNKALIEYFNGEEYTYVFTITKDTASFQSIPLVDNTEIEEFRKALTPNFKHKNPSQAYRDYTNSAYELFKKILATLLKILTLQR